VSQETLILRLWDSEGAVGTGYSYTIGTGGRAVQALLTAHLLPQLEGLEPAWIERILHDLRLSTHATTVGPLTSLALATIDTALWDLKCRREGAPLHLVAGGAREAAPAYTTETGWLHLSQDALVDGVLRARADGFAGAKIKVGKPRLAEDVARLGAVRAAVGDGFEIMVDCNQKFNLDEALRWARALEPFDLTWMEEPLPADDISGHGALARQTSIPIAAGESLYSIGQFGAYIQAGACSVVQVDAARVGGITPWLKVAHGAACHNLAVAPHFLMELHLPLVCAAPNARWVEHIPQLEMICASSPQLKAGALHPSNAAGLGIDWDWDAITAHPTHAVETVDFTR
jgi:L-alanine-DL-glutamate epimerase-like enolase superfamily enzyme